MNSDVQEKFESYPESATAYLLRIRELIIDIARDEELGELSESLKWGEPSYASKSGSPVRIDWKAKNPDQVSIYFNCKTNLVETFKEIYQDTLQLIGNRELVMPLSQDLPEQEIRQCLSMALRYHKIKQLPLLGA